MSFEIINPESLGRPSGWNNGMLARPGGRILFVAGQAAPPGTLIDQWDRALGKILTVVKQAGGRAEDIGRMTVFVTDLATYLASRQALGEVHRKHLGRHYPAMALVEVRALVDPQASVEIEATAVI
ncbi:MAG TPA: Rid family hydrolase [Gemmatimonadales bacterium]|nr:Rid family hydrolase [Gemmatimonadales bacterium]